MANPVTYNSGSNPTGALKSGTMSMSIASSLDITGYNWRNGFENSNIWVIYSDTYSMGQTTQGNSVPTIWATPVYTDSGLVTLINSLSERAGQTPFTTISDAVTWLIGQGKYFLSNQNYPMLVSNGLLYFMDAGFTASYPTFGTSLYDLSGNNNTGTLVNGTGYVNSNTNGYFTFDGTDDKINIPGSFPSSLSEYTVEYTAFLVSQNRMPIGSFSNNSFYKYGDNSWYYTHGGSAAEFYYPGGQITGWGHWVITYDGSFVKVYRKGVILGQQASSGTANFSAGWILGYWNPGGNYAWDGYISSARIYNRALSQSEVLQNYYKGPIVTTNLSYLWDASNLVSYYSGSSTTYEMLNTGVNGTLQNGVGYSGNYGGYWSFDGTDDRILLSSSITLGNGDSDWTVNAWIRTTSLDNGLTANPILSNTNGGPIYGSFDTTQGYQAYWAYPSNINDWKKFQGNIFVADNQWHMLTYVNKSNYTMDFYVDGVYDTTVSPTNVSNNNPLDVIGGGLGTSFDGSIGMVQVNKGIAMNASQVSQQYGATRGRFESYQAFANGGTVTTLTQNGINYRVHTFNSSGTLSVTKGGDVEVLMVAGGGGGGSAADSFWEAGGGGGAGGLIHNTGFPVTDGTNYTVTIGAGGAGGLNQTNTAPSNRSGNGNNTTFSTLTAVGGGGGGGAYYASTTGGSGGGAEAWIYGPGSAGTQFQGYNGGAGNGMASTNGAGGGGGGAGGPGQNGQAVSPLKGGDGGIGQSFTFVGNTPTYYAGGGGAKTAASGSGPGGVGGLGGGGNGGVAGGSAVGTSGTANTGGGGGGGLSTSTPTGSGGSGVVMIRYIIP
jgi:hypothetical protein